MEKLDLKKQLESLYSSPKNKFVVIDVPKMSFLMVDGHGDPNKAPQYQAAVEALYSVAYGIKFMCKKELGIDFGVAPLEGLWWVANMENFSVNDKDSWDWTMMIMQPDMITYDMFQRAAEQARKKKDLPALSLVRWEPYEEGLSVQIMHIGPYSAEGPVLAKMHHEFIPENGYLRAGKHHEIYLGDPRKSAPEKLRTILRQPIRQVDKI